MNLKIKELTLKNYRNIKYQSLYFGGASAFICGENRRGKTNTLEALYWLLTDDLLNSSDISRIKPNGDNNDLITSVCAVFSYLDCGITKTLELKKEFKSVFKNERGEEVATFQGNKTDYYINNLLCETKTDFIKQLADILRVEINADINIIKALINPLYFGELGEGKDWQDLRRFIENLAPKDTTESADYSALTDDLTRYDGDIEKVKKYYRSSIKALSTQEAAEKGKIDYIESLPRVSSEEKERAELFLKQTQEDEPTDKINKLKTDISTLERRINAINTGLEDKTSEEHKLAENRELLIKQIKEIKPLTVCPTCHHTLTDEEQKATTDKIKADLIVQGKAEKLRRDELKADIDKLLADYKLNLDLLESKNKELKELTDNQSNRAVMLNNITHYSKVLADYERQEINDEKADEYKNKLRDYTRQRIAFEQKLEVAKSYYIKQAERLDNIQLSLFGKKYFAFLKHNINGTDEPICKVLVNEKTLWANASKSERILTGIEIIEKLKKILDLPTLPILFDEGGEISSNSFQKITTDAQVICVKVVDNIESIEIRPIN